MSASDVIATFEAKSGGGVWKNISRADVVTGLRARVADRGSIDTSSNSLCGPAAFLYSVLSEYPEDYCNYICDLYDTGKGKLWDFVIKPGSDTKNYKVPTDKIHVVDWIGLGGLRDSENGFFDYQSVDDDASAVTFPMSLESWFKKATYNTRHNVTNLVLTKSQSDIETANSLRNQGLKVCLFINADMLYTSEQDKKSKFPDHWVVLTGPVLIKDGKISLEVFTWGKAKRKVPQSGELSLSSFINNFYGYVAAK